MSINLSLPETVLSQPRILVMGVGGAGGNAVNNMVRAKLIGPTFIAANTDAQALEHSSADSKVQLGISVTQGLGAGSVPAIGKQAAEESIEEIKSILKDTNMIFITAGMGGGTGTGASPVIAKLAKEMGILTIGVVTKPFMFEGITRMQTAEEGLNTLEQYVDTLIVIPNQNLFKIATENTTFAEAFQMADDVLYSGVKGVTDLMIMPGLINLDFADIKSIMAGMGKAMMGSAEAEGEDRATKAAEAAITNPLLDFNYIGNARSILINISGGKDITLFEIERATNIIRSAVEENGARIIFGSIFDDSLEGKIRVSVVATGLRDDILEQTEQSYSNQKDTRQSHLDKNNNNIGLQPQQIHDHKIDSDIYEIPTILRKK